MLVCMVYITILNITMPIYIALIPNIAIELIHYLSQFSGVIPCPMMSGNPSMAIVITCDIVLDKNTGCMVHDFKYIISCCISISIMLLS